MTDRDCSRCVFARPYGGENDNRCASWSCEFIDYKEAVKAYEAMAEIVRCKDCKWYSVKYFDGSDRANPLCRVFNRYFIKAVIPYAEKHGIKLALHPDDPPLEKLGDVERIMINYENIKKAMEIGNSKNLGVTSKSVFLYG